MGIKAYHPWGNGDFLSIKDSPNITMKYSENTMNTYKDVFQICNNGIVVVEITGHNVSEAMVAIIDGASIRHRTLIREYLDYADSGYSKDFKWSKQ